MSEENSPNSAAPNPSFGTEGGQSAGPAPQAGGSPASPGQPAPNATPAGQPAPGAQPGPGSVPAGQSMPGSAPTGAPGPAYATPAPMQQPVKDTTPLVLGILSIVFAGIVGLILGILGLNKSKKVLKLVESSKAKAGKITSIIGIVLSVIAIVVVIVAFALGFSVLGGPSQAADEAMQSICEPSDSDRAQFTEGFEESFSSAAGVSTSEVGLDSNKMASWLYDDVTYSQTGVETQNNTATVTYSVTSHDMNGLIDTASTNLSNLSQDQLVAATASESAYYSLIGQVLNESMDETAPTTKTVTVHLTKSNGTWTVSDSEKQDLINDIYVAY